MTSGPDGQSSNRGKGCASVAVVALAAFALLAFGTGSAFAAAPTLTVDPGPTPSYVSAEVSGELDPADNDVYYWFQYSQDPDVEGWTNGPEIFTRTLVANSGPTAVAETLTGLKGGTEYKVRLVAFKTDESEIWTSEAPYVSFTTLPVGPPGVSIDPVSAVTATGAHFSGHVDPEAPAGDPAAFDVHWEFKCTPECPGLQGGTVEAAEGEQEVEADATGLEPNVEYKVELLATNVGGAEAEAGPEAFTTDAVAPVVETIPAFALEDGTAALVGGRVNPKNSATTYWIEYGTDATYGSSFPPSEDADAGSGGQAQVVTLQLTGLTPGTEYHYRVVAENAEGESPGEDMTFEATSPASPESCPNTTLRAENNSTALSECRAYEQVSPLDKNGYDAGTKTSVLGYVAAEDGSALSFESYGGFAAPLGTPAISTYLSTRGSGGWVTQALTPQSLPSGVHALTEFLEFTPDLRYAVVNPQSSPPLAPGATPDANNLYLRDNETGEYRTLNLGGSAPIFFAAAASADGRHILFEATGPVTPDSPAAAEKNLYEWSDGQIQLVGIDEQGTPIPAGGTIEAYTRTEATTHAISEDGSRVVFKSAEDGQLYLRENGLHTYKISGSQLADPDPAGPGVVTFRGASADTSAIYFTDTEALTEDAVHGVFNLYHYDANTRTLTDLSSSVPGNASVDRVAGISDDGSRVYFLANSVIYLWQNDTVTPVARASRQPSQLDANHIRYRVSGDGRYLTFPSADRLTAYDNTDAITGEPDAEVYVFDAVSGQLSCASCNPDGEPPHGASSFPEPPNRPLRNLQRGAGSDGTVFFNSSDALVPADVNGAEDAYEWKEGRVHLLSSGTSQDPSFYVSASKSGDDAFFATREQLIDSDRDQLLDVYDARVGGGFPRAVQSSPCEEIDPCRGAVTPVPGSADPPSTIPSPGEAAAQRARKLKAALRNCREKPRKARAKCRTRARRRFAKEGRAG